MISGKFCFDLIISDVSWFIFVFGVLVVVIVVYLNCVWKIVFNYCFLPLSMIENAGPAASKYSCLEMPDSRAVGCRLWDHTESDRLSENLQQQQQQI